MAGDLRRQRDRRLLLFPGRCARHESGPQRTHRQYLERRRPWNQPHRHPGLCIGEGRQIGLTRQLAHELGPWGITVNNIAPGFVRSNPTTERQWESYGDEGQRALVDRIALKRLGTPDDIAHGVLFFASDYAGWITGQVLSIDGGK